MSVCLSTTHAIPTHAPHKNTRGHVCLAGPVKPYTVGDVVLTEGELVLTEGELVFAEGELVFVDGVMVCIDAQLRVTPS